MFLGLAIGDALGMPLEFKERGTFAEIETMQAGGAFNLPVGYWTDDTSMALCLADSILENRGYDSYDVMDRYAKWRNEGYRSSTGACFDIGNQTTTAISEYLRHPQVSVETQRGESAGNGSIMRLTPVVMASLAARNSLEQTMALGAASARETHYSIVAETATAIFAAMLAKAVDANTKQDVLDFSTANYAQSDPIVAVIKGAASKTPDVLKPTGYVIDTLEVAMWAFMTTDTFKEGALKTVNMGGDADTIGAVYGQLAGAYYGCQGIPSEWLEVLHDSADLRQLASSLSSVDHFSILRTRFDEDIQGSNLLG